MKSQAETAGHLTNSSGPHPQRGTVLRDLELTLVGGSRCLLSSLRGSTSLVMLFTGGRNLHVLFSDLESKQPALKEHNGRVLMIATAHPASDTQPASSADLFSQALDEAGTVHKALGAIDANPKPVPSIYITDRFGEVFAAFHNTDIGSLPNAQEIIRWLEFIEQQCDESSPPEWPKYLILRSTSRDCSLP